ncbi:hypothetical protein ACFL6X_00500 [Candidatus Latescibacterota bacterium]
MNIQIRGANEGVLQAVDVDVPLGQLVAFTGPSGSGARTMAAEVLLAESRRRYLAALSPFEREAAGGVAASAEVDSIDGLPPAAALPGASPRATRVSTFLRLDEPAAEIFHRQGEVSCPHCEGPCRAYSAEAAASELLGRFAGARVLVLAPLKLTGVASPEATLGELRRAGFLRLRRQGQVVRLQDGDGAAAANSVGEPGDEAIEVVVDRVTVANASRTRLSEAIRNARAIARGRTLIVPEGPAEAPGQVWYNQQLTCTRCGREFAELTDSDLIPGAESPHAHRIALAGRSVAEVQELSIDGALSYWEEVVAAAETGDHPISGAVIAALTEPLRQACGLGLGYVALGRRVDSLSHGEWRLLATAAAAARGLAGILYVVDRPVSVLDGPHLAMLLEAFRGLVRSANTVVVVDNDPVVVAACEHQIAFSEGSLAAGSQTPDQQVWEAAGPPRRSPGRGCITVRGGVGLRNLADVNLEVPAARLVGITGPTGSGKTALIGDLLSAALGSGGRRAGIGAKGLLVGGEDIRRFALLSDELAPGDGDRALVEHLGIAAQVARLYSQTPAAQQRGYPPEWFQLDRPGGRCTMCEGRGVLRCDLDFMEDLSQPCPTCEGMRYRPEVLEITERGYSVGDVLAMTVDASISHFAREPRISPRLEAAAACALGRRQLGEAAGRLDPPEVLRLRLAIELSRASARDLLALVYPAAGLHRRDVDALVSILRLLVERGASVWVEERHPVVLAECDFTVAMGPGGGPEGGRVTAAGAGESWS